MKIVFVVNNKNNRLAKVLPLLEDYFEHAKLGAVHFHTTKRKKHAIELARQATMEGCDYVIAVGGDGTLHEVINGVFQNELSANDYPAIGLLPYGSANDFARTAGISNSMEKLHEFIQTRNIQKIDLGRIELHGNGNRHYFINIAGIGLGAEVAHRMEGTSSIFGSGFNYFKHIIIGFLRYTKKEICCTSSTWQWKGKILQMAVANGRYFGNAICIAPDAQLSDGSFKISIFGDLSIWDYLRNIGKLKKGVKINLPQVNYQAAQEVMLESDEECGVEADGEYVGSLPATITVVPEAICFLMPSNLK